jgi:S-DNA-T family DNA segregation ATPase FtsK/SpoIIIE
MPIPFGLEDLPELQLQVPATFDLEGGHMLVIGSSRSGRSQCLRTIAGSAGQAISPNDVHMYGLDCGNGALLPLSALPHCGAVVGRNQPERAIRLLARLMAELGRRQALLASRGFADIHEQRRSAASEERLPHVLFFLDRWEGFTSSLAELDGGMPMESVLTMLREGASAGIHAIMTGDRTLASGRVGSLCDNKLALRMADRNDYSFVGLNPRKLPDEIPPGRSFNTERGTEIQVALLVEDDSGQAQAAALSEIAAKVQAATQGLSGLRPFRIDELPSRLSFEDAQAYETVGAFALFALVGVGGDELAALGPDLSRNPSFIVAGPSRSGRSTALVSMARSVITGGAEVLIVAPRNSPLRDLAGAAGVRAVITDARMDLEGWQSHLGTGEKPLVVVIDDGEDLKDSPAGEALRGIIQGSSAAASALILGGTPGAICTGISGWQIEAKKARQGLLLSPQAPTDGELVSARIPRSAVGGPPQPGRGWLHLGDGDLKQVAIPS